MERIEGFLRYWYDFVVGDDWRVAVGVVVGLGLTALLASFGLAAWWLMPLAAIALLVLSTWLNATEGS
jgi:hypothetical protein